MVQAERPEPTAPGVPQLVRIDGLTKRFTGTLALDHVNLVLNAGEVHALLGENGAGKSTLIKILAGVYGADSGEIYFEGRRLAPLERPAIAFIHQDLGLVDDMTVAENIALVVGYPRRAGAISWRHVRRQAERVLETVSVTVGPDQQVAELSAAEKSLVAIARALAISAPLVVLDEPTAALPESDVAGLFTSLSRLRQVGVGVLYVTHRLDEVFRLADRVTVLRDGRRVLTDSVEALTPQALVHAIVGRPLAEVFIEPVSAADDYRARVALQEVVAGDGTGPITMSVQSGEIVGLVGLRGAGHHSVGRLIFGDAPQVSGEMTLEGRSYHPSGVADAMRHGVGFVSSKRAEEGLALELKVRENLYMNPARDGRVLRRVMPAAERSRADGLIGSFNIRPADPERTVGTLSGGNQQKVLLARWLEGNRSRLLVLEEPTFGVDVGSKAQIYGMLGRYVASGGAVLLISSDFEEVAGVCHRALVFNRGRVVAEVSRDNLTEQTLTALASGGTAGPATRSQ